MEEIPVKQKAPVAVIPIWALVLGVVALASLIGFILMMRHRAAANNTEESVAVVTHGAQCSEDSQCGDRQLCLSSTCMEIKSGLADCTIAQVHFATDGADIRAEDKAGVARMARCLKADQSIKLTIAGNADERGPSDHNVELGEQRAMAVARALQAQGVSSKQLSVVSYGDNHPLCVESDKECWAKNRRASLTPQVATP